MQGFLALGAMFVIAFYIEYLSSRAKNKAQAEYYEQQAEALKALNEQKARNAEFLELRHKVQIAKLKKDLNEIESNK